MEARSGGDCLKPAPPGQAAITSRPRSTSWTAITSRSRRSPVNSGASFTSAGQPARASRVGRPEGRDRHPGVGTPAGRRSLTAGIGGPRARILDVHDRRRPDPPHPAGRPARPSRRPGGGRPRPIGPRPGRRPSSSGPGSAASPTRSRTRPPSRSTSCPAGRPRPRPGHVGRLLLGRLAGVPVIVLQGRFHLYEGFDAGLVIQPVLLFKRLGARLVLLTNAAGGVNPATGPGR